MSVASGPIRAIALKPPSWRRWLVLPVLSLAVGMVGIDVSIVSVANPTIQRDLHASLGDLQWVTNAYLLALCALLLNAGRFADRVGRKRVFIAGVATFALSSAGCALSGSIGELIIWRTIQGAAGALLMPTSLAILQNAFTGKELDIAIATWGATTLGSIVIGPIAGGLLVEHVSWQSVFLINVPIAVLAVAGSVWVLVESRDPDASHSLDVTGSVVGGVGLFVLVFDVIKAQTHGWGSPYTLGFLAAALALLAAFVVREATAREPMLPPELFRSVPFSAAIGLALLTYFTFYGLLFFWTLYLQRVLGDSPVTSGVHLLPLTGGFLCGVPIGGWIGVRYGLRAAMLIGLLGLVVACALLATVQISDGYGGLWPAFLLLGGSLALAAVSGIEAILSNAPVRLGGIAGGAMTTASQLGGVLGIAVLGSVLASHASSALAHDLTAHGIHNASQLATHLTTGSAGSLKPLLAHVPRPVARHLTSDGSHAFLSGLHVVMWVAAGVALVGAQFAHLVERGDTEVAPGHIL